MNRETIDAATANHGGGDMIFHIRRKLKAPRGNQFYRDKEFGRRFNGTYCGEKETSYDIGWRDKAEPFNTYEPCEKCIKQRDAEKDNK